MSLIRCPNCGSSAQIELAWAGSTNYFTTHTQMYECGCGCLFKVVFEVREIEILEKDT